MHSGTSTLYLISVDMDGTVAAPNHPINGDYEKFLKALQRIPQIEVILNSGKSVSYLEEEAARIGARYVIANNGASLQMLGGEQVVFGGNRRDILRLRHLLALRADDEGVRPVPVDREVYTVAVEGGKEDLVLTLFSDPKTVKHRYQFNGGVDRHELYEHLRDLVRRHGLNLHVLEPHGDGAIDVVRLHNSKPIDKSTLPKLVREVWRGARAVHISMLGDGSNDVPAMLARGVTGITFPESHPVKVVQPVIESGGIVTQRNAWRKTPAGHVPGGGVIEGIHTLAERGFFGRRNKEVARVCMKFLKKYPL